MIGTLFSWFLGTGGKTKRKQTTQTKPTVSQPASVNAVEEWLEDPTEDNMEIFGLHCRKGIIVGTEIEYYGARGRNVRPGKRRQMIMFGDLKGPLGLSSCVHLADERQPWSRDGSVGGHFVWCEAAGGLFWIEIGEDGGVDSRVRIDRSRVLFYKGRPMARVAPAPEGSPAPSKTFNVVFADNVYFDPMICSWRNERGHHSWLEVAQAGMHRPGGKPQVKPRRRVKLVDTRWQAGGGLHEEVTMQNVRPSPQMRRRLEAIQQTRQDEHSRKVGRSQAPPATDNSQVDSRPPVRLAATRERVDFRRLDSNPPKATSNKGKEQKSPSKSRRAA